MGHHHIEIKQEKFEFTSRSKMLSVLLLAVGIILSVIGVYQIKGNESHTVEKHARRDKPTLALARNARMTRGKVGVVCVVNCTMPDGDKHQDNQCCDVHGAECP